MLSGQPFLASGDVVLYARFTVNFQVLPKGPSGSYFAHFKDGATGFRGRVFATTNGAGPDMFRVGIANAGNNADQVIATDLHLNASYALVLRWAINGALGTLWLDPQQESDPGVTATDTATAVPITAMAFRQSMSSGNGMGALRVDDVVVSTSFTEAFSTNPPPVLPPSIHFTNFLENLVRPGDLTVNTFAEHCLRPGEKLTIQVAITDPAGRGINVNTPSEGLPPSARWGVEPPVGSQAAVDFVFQPTASEAGNRYCIKLAASNDTATSEVTWTVYVPTLEEQGIVINEFLANPATTNTAPHFNPLQRDTPSPKPASDDEYIELVNVLAGTVDLGGWTVSDTVQVRHQFDQGFRLPGSSAVIVYGGPAAGFAPGLEVPAIPASEGGAGLGLNNTGSDSILVRNQQSNLVVRVVYTEKVLSTNGSVTRYPDLSGPFMPQAMVAADPVSPGNQCDGRPFADSAILPPANFQTSIILDIDGGVGLHWNAEPDRTYSVWQAEQWAGPFALVASGLCFPDGAGTFADNIDVAVAQRFYRISTP
jgi:hypothetical protein